MLSRNQQQNSLPHHEHKLGPRSRKAGQGGQYFFALCSAVPVGVEAVLGLQLEVLLLQLVGVRELLQQPGTALHCCRGRVRVGAHSSPLAATSGIQFADVTAILPMHSGVESQHVVLAPARSGCSSPTPRCAKAATRQLSAQYSGGNLDMSAPCCTPGRGVPAGPWRSRKTGKQNTPWAWIEGASWVFSPGLAQGHQLATVPRRSTRPRWL